MSFVGINVAGQFACADASFSHTWLNFESATITRDLWLTNFEPGFFDTVSLILANVGTLNVDETSWPRRGGLHVQGLKYDYLAGPTFEAYGGCVPALEWLSHQSATTRWLAFESQPWTQLAAVFAAAGRTRDARDVLIDMNWRRTIGGIGTLISHLLMPFRAAARMLVRRNAPVATAQTEEDQPILSRIILRAKYYIAHVLPPSLVVVLLSLLGAKSLGWLPEEFSNAIGWKTALGAAVFLYALRSVILGYWLRHLSDLTRNFFLRGAALAGIFLTINQHPDAYDIRIAIGLLAGAGIFASVQWLASKRWWVAIWLRDLIQLSVFLAIWSGALILFSRALGHLYLPDVGLGLSVLPVGLIAVIYGVGFLWSSMIVERSWLIRLLSLIVAIPTNIILGALIGWGFRPILAAIWGLVLSVVGWFVFSTIYQAGFMTADLSSYDERCRVDVRYEKFSPLAYSIDTLIPFVDLLQERYWHPSNERIVCKQDERGKIILDSDGFAVLETEEFPRLDLSELTRADLLPPPIRALATRAFPNFASAKLNKETTGWLEDRFQAGWARKYLWFHIAIGYVLATMAAAAITGIVKLRD